MISVLTGELISVATDRIVVSVGGVGFEVFVSHRHSLKLKSGLVTVFTRLVVKEDELSLYGFESTEERDLFDQLCSVSGIGPKLALTTLNGMTSEDLRDAVESQDETAFRAVPGIGPKTAKLIILSLTGKLSPGKSKRYPNVEAALLQLGTSAVMVSKVLGALEPGLSDGDALKRALAELGSGKLSDQ